MQAAVDYLRGIGGHGSLVAVSQPSRASSPMPQEGPRAIGQIFMRHREANAPPSSSQGNPAAEVPSAFADGYKRARAVDPSLADTYVPYLRRGDPAADAVMEDFAMLDHREAERFLRAALEQREETLCRAPRSLQSLVHQAATLSGYERELCLQGCRCFLHHPDQFLAAFVAGGIVEGFSTMISKSFGITGRMIDDGVRRLKQNVRHLVDTFMPYGIEPYGDGWKATLRIRMVHARVRALLKTSSEWDHDAWGMPVSAAHLALASAAFSARLLEFLTMLGVPLAAGDRRGVMAVWYHCFRLMGIPEELLYRREADARRLYRIAAACEPTPDEDAIALAHCIINLSPVVAGTADPTARHNAARYIYRISRELVGDATAERLRFPPKQRIPLLPFLRAKALCRRAVGRVVPKWAAARKRTVFLNLLDLAHIGDARVSSRLPDHVKSDRSRRY